MSENTALPTHSFGICAYQKSPYLEAAILSLISQSVKSRIFISTSTPSDFIDSLASKYSLPVFVNKGKHSCPSDWNFAMDHADTDYFTLCHQDDIYESDYTRRMLAAIRAHSPALIAFSDYYEIRENESKAYNNKNLRIKKLMNVPFRIFPNSRFIRRRVLSLGCSICCPSVMFDMRSCGDARFDTEMSNSMDWELWCRLSARKGSFVYVGAPLMGHRIHMESTTSKTIAEGTRFKEDMSILRRFWPEPLAKAIMKSYMHGMDGNRLKCTK